MKLIDVATDRPVTVAMFTFALVLFGLVALSRLAVTLLPDLAYPTLTVRTELPGAAPQEVETLLTRAVEDAVGVVSGVRRVRSVSRAEQSDVTLEFAWGTRMDVAGIEVREKLDVLELPLEARRPLLLRFDPASEPIMRLAIAADDDEVRSTANGLLEYRDPDERLQVLRTYAEEQIKRRLESVGGVAAVHVSGGLEEEIHVLADQQRLSQLGLSVETVAARLRAENVNLSGGRLEQGVERFLVRTVNEFRTVDDMAGAIIAVRDRQPVYLRDVAEVTRGHRERETITRVDGRESIELGLYREGDANTVRTAAAVHERVEALRRELPDNVRLTIVNDQSVFIASAIHQVQSAALIGGVLAVLLLYGFLRDLRATVVIGLAIPVSVVGSFLLMFASGLTLNIMSLGGIALAIGLLVDNSIVVLENITRRRENGDDLLTAAREGTREVAGAVTAATLTTVAVFFPMVFVTGIAGQLFRDQALTVTFALLLSLLVALTLLPMLASAGARRGTTLPPEPESPPGRGTRAVGWLLRQLRRPLRFGARGVRALARVLLVRPCQGFLRVAEYVYVPLLDASLRRRGVVVVTAAAVFAGTMLLVPRLGTELVPQLSQGEFAVDIRLRPGASLAQTDRAIQGAQRAAAAVDGVTLTYSAAGTGHRLDANPVDAGEHTGTLHVRLARGTTRADEDAAMRRMRTELDRIPGVDYEFRRPEILSFATPLEVEISGHDLDALAVTASAVAATLAGDDRFADIRSSVETGNPELQVVFDHARAAQLGLVVRDVADRVVANVRGDVATRYTWRDREIDVLVRSVDARNTSIAELRNLIMNPNSARPVPLEAVADIRVMPGPAEIRRVDQSRAATVSAGIERGDLGSAVVAAEALLSSVPLPEGVSLRITGQTEEMREALGSMQFSLLMAVFLVYLVMASKFESLVHPFVILFTIPLALVGVVLALWLTGTTLSVVAFIGVIMLTGIVVNNAIVLVDFINQLRDRGVEKMQAIRDATRARLRPILMTTMTTALGLLPMALGFGEGAEVRAPMAIAVIGGLLTATLLTLVVIPVVYSLLAGAGQPAAATTGGVQEART